KFPMAFRYKTPFTIASSQVPSTQTNMPVLVAPSNSRFKTVANGGHVASKYGYDIRPFSDPELKTPLYYEMVYGNYDASVGTFEMWVNVPTVQDGTTIWLGYGDPSLTVDGTDCINLWDNTYGRVMHFGNSTSIAPVNPSPNFTVIDSAITKCDTNGSKFYWY